MNSSRLLSSFLLMLMLAGCAVSLENTYGVSPDRWAQMNETERAAVRARYEVDQDHYEQTRQAAEKARETAKAQQRQCAEAHSKDAEADCRVITRTRPLIE